MTLHTRPLVRGPLACRRRRSVRHGFILLFGTKPVYGDEAGEPVRTACPRCNQVADLRPRSYRTWFTLFFLPLFPVGGKHRFTECSNCGGQFPVAPEELRSRLADSERQQSQQAIGLYNSLRASPANAITLSQLMDLYATMGEFDQAIAAAGQFPQALEASEQCMVTLGRVYLAKGQPDEALRWIDTAAARNPQLPDAQYVKGLAHLMKTPPEYDRAIAAARAARSLGHPDADRLVREAESRARGAQ